MKKVIIALMMAVLIPLISWSQAVPVYDQASDINTSTTNFNKNLSHSDTDVQKALETLDELISSVDLSLYAKLANPHFTGLVGIGSTSPRAALDVNGYIYGDGTNMAGVLHTFVEVDPIYASSPAAGISSANISTWNAAQAGDADLTAIAALSGTAGHLRKTATNTWDLDTTVYQPAGLYLTAEADTLATVVARGATTNLAVGIEDQQHGRGAGVKMGHTGGQRIRLSAQRRVLTFEHVSAK